MLEQHEAEDAVRLVWLRSAANDAFSALGRGESIEFASMESLETFIHQTADELKLQQRRA